MITIFFIFLWLSLAMTFIWLCAFALIWLLESSDTRALRAQNKRNPFARAARGSNARAASDSRASSEHPRDYLLPKPIEVTDHDHHPSPLNLRLGPQPSTFLSGRPPRPGPRVRPAPELRRTTASAPNANSPPSNAPAR
jgi:hypothetical protein